MNRFVDGMSVHGN